MDCSGHASETTYSGDDVYENFILIFFVVSKCPGRCEILFPPTNYI